MKTKNPTPSMPAPDAPPTLGSTAWFVWWPNARRPHYLLAALIAGPAIGLAWTGVQHLPNTAGEITVKVDASRFGLVLGVLTTFFIAAGNWVLRQSARDWCRISTPGFDRTALTAATFAPSRRTIMILVLAGVLMGTVQLWVTGDLAFLAKGRPPALLATIALVILFWTLMVQVAGVFLILIRGFYRLGLEIEPDLLRIEPLAPFSYVGLRILAVNAGSTMILMFTIGLGDADIQGLAVPLGFTALISATCFLLPQLGLRRSIRRTRTRMLAQLDAHLDRTGFPSPSALDADDAPHRIAALASLRERIAQSPDWPVTAISWLRFAILLLLPAASWLIDKLLLGLLS